MQQLFTENGFSNFYNTVCIVYCILPSAMSSKSMYVCMYIHMCEPSLDNQITYYGRSTQSTANTQKLHINVSYNLIHQQYC